MAISIRGNPMVKIHENSIWGFFFFNSAMFLPFLLLCLFTATRAATLPPINPICALVTPYIQPCNDIIYTGNLTDPSFEHCCQGLHILSSNAYIHGRELISIRVHAELQPNGTTASYLQQGCMILSKLEQECRLNVKFPGFLLDYRCFYLI